MDSLQFLQTIKQRWYLLAGSVAATLLLAIVLSAASPINYQATSSLFVAVTAEGAQSPNQGNLLASSPFLDSQIQSFIQFASSPTVTDAAAKEAGAPIPAGSVTATASPGTYVINLTATAAKPLTAKLRANAVAKQLAKYIPSVATRLPNGTPAFAVTIVKPATVPSSASSPRWSMNLALGLLLGLAGGLALLLILGQLDASNAASKTTEQSSSERENASDADGEG